MTWQNCPVSLQSYKHSHGSRKAGCASWEGQEKDATVKTWMNCLHFKMGMCKGPGAGTCQETPGGLMRATAGRMGNRRSRGFWKGAR